MGIFGWALLITAAVLAVAGFVYLLLALRLRDSLKIYGKISLPYVVVPMRGIWRLWPDGRSMTLKLPVVGVFAAIHTKDAMADWKRFVTLSHEEQHGIEIREQGYSWFWYYLVSKAHRFRSELKGFAASVKARETMGVVRCMVPGRSKPVSLVHYGAFHLSQDYRLGPDFPFRYCYDSLSEMVHSQRGTGGGIQSDDFFGGGS